MIRPLRRIAIAIFLGWTTTLAGMGLPKMYQAQDGREALQAARQSGKPVMLYFTQIGCVYCDKVERLLATSEARFALVESYHFVNIDIRASRDPVIRALMKMLQVRGTPAFAFLAPNAEPICMFYGTIRDDAELVRIHDTVQRLYRGAAPTEQARGYASCRGRASPADNFVTEVRETS